MDVNLEMEVLGREIRRRRREVGISQYDLADATGLTQAAISRYEQGQRAPRLTTMMKINKALRCRLIVTPVAVRLEEWK